MIGWAFGATATLYGVACVLFLAMLFRDRPSRIEHLARYGLVLAGLSHSVYIGAEYFTLGHTPFESVHGTFSMVSLLAVVGFLVALLKFRIGVLGALLVPLTLLFFMGAGLGQSVDPVPDDVRSIILPVHIVVNIFGLVAFLLAAVAATGYVIQERMLRQKTVSGISRRLPALGVLDSLSLRLVTVGFPLLTVGIVTGGMWAVRIEPNAALFTTSQSFAIAAWVLFAAVLMLRVAVGWRGRRAAIGTIAGFLCTVLVLASYALRDSVGAS